MRSKVAPTPDIFRTSGEAVLPALPPGEAGVEEILDGPAVDEVAEPAPRGVNPLNRFVPLIGVPTTASGHDQEVVMIVGAVVIGVTVLVCACSITVLRRRGRSRG
ncbi:hypothetical protein [Spirillospora sp. NBC_01491]|uniref:hypothetical protein n=1 Tax=Spirillospora sp. NBC_01491 TaxID=2976007 RepID=UPI002E33886D|nr:hypothetical protein [Spirillospora sp. NBC_01491]